MKINIAESFGSIPVVQMISFEAEAKVTNRPNIVAACRPSLTVNMQPVVYSGGVDLRKITYCQMTQIDFGLKISKKSQGFSFSI